MENPEYAEQAGKTNDIPILNLLKHYPYHNTDYSIWLDVEYGKEEGWECLDTSDGIRFEEQAKAILDQIPDNLNQVVEIEGKGFRRQIGICNVKDVNEIKKIIANSKHTDTFTEKHYNLKELQDTINAIKAVK